MNVTMISTDFTLIMGSLNSRVTTVISKYTAL